MDGNGGLAPVLDRIPDVVPGDGRFVVAIAGPPAAGKSTIAAALVEALDGRAGLLAMDGFHFDNTILDARGHRDRKGAPHTFDTSAFRTVLGALRDDRTTEMAVPVYDRAMSLARNCASFVDRGNDIVVTEGNYLLLDTHPWSGLCPMFDLTVWIDVPLSVVETRIRDRWVAAGLEESEIARRTHENDLPNARLVQSSSAPANVIVSQ